jgi:hypothetical protein
MDALTAVEVELEIDEFHVNEVVGSRFVRETHANVLNLHQVALK